MLFPFHYPQSDILQTEAQSASPHSPFPAGVDSQKVTEFPLALSNV